MPETMRNGSRVSPRDPNSTNASSPRSNSPTADTPVNVPTASSTPRGLPTTNLPRRTASAGATIPSNHTPRTVAQSPTPPPPETVALPSSPSHPKTVEKTPAPAVEVVPTTATIKEPTTSLAPIATEPLFREATTTPIPVTSQSVQNSPVPAVPVVVKVPAAVQEASLMPDQTQSKVVRFSAHRSMVDDTLSLFCLFLVFQFTSNSPSNSNGITSCNIS